MVATTDKGGPCVNWSWKAKASGCAFSPGPLMKPLNNRIYVMTSVKKTSKLTTSYGELEVSSHTSDAETSGPLLLTS